jgi:hypothetical protein
MNCQTAQIVWGHPEGFLAGLKATLPRAFDRIERVVLSLVRGETNPFNEAVHRKVGHTCRRYFVSHADDGDPVAAEAHDVIGDAAACRLLEKHFSAIHGQDICLGNICCSGCEASFGRLCDKDLVAIQGAAVRTDEHGNDIAI